MVSVIIPVYNVIEYLDECINSVINQTYRNLEIILIDDGSTDASAALCDEYEKRDPRVKVIHKKNAGLSSARNKGLEIASGEFVYFIDSDDWIKEETIEVLLKKIEDIGAEFLFFDANVFYDGCSEDTFPFDFYNRGREYGVCEDSAKMFDILLDNKHFRSSVNLLFIKKELFDKYNLHFYEGILYEDELFTATLFLLGVKTAHLSCKFYNRRVRPKSIVTSTMKPINFKSQVIIIGNLIDMKKSFTSEIKDNACSKDIIRLSLNLNKKYRCLSTIDRLVSSGVGIHLVEDVKENVALDERLYQKLKKPYYDNRLSINRLKSFVKRFLNK